MKVKVSVPTEPVCTVKLEIEEAKCLLLWLTGDRAVKTTCNTEAFMAELSEQLYKNLGIKKEGPLFKDVDAEAEIVEDKDNPGQLPGSQPWPF